MGWCRPDACAAHSICVICGSNSSCSLSAHGRAEWRFARSAGTGGVPRRLWCGSNGDERRACGLVVTGRDRLAAADVLFYEIAQQPRPPPGQAPSDGSDPGGATTPRKDRHRSRWPRFLRNCATTLPPGQAPSVGSDPGGPRPRGRIDTGCGGLGFCEIAQRPARRGRLLPWGPIRAGPRPRGRIDTGRGGLGFCEIAQRPWPPPGQAPPAGFDPDASATQGRTGTGRGGRVFAKRATTLGRVPRGHARCNGPPPGCGPGGTNRGRDGARWHRRGRIAGSGSAMAVRTVAAGVFSRNRDTTPRVKCSRACPMQLSASQSMLLVSPIGGPAHRGPGGSEWNTSPLSDRGPDPL